MRLLQLMERMDEIPESIRRELKKQDTHPVTSIITCCVWRNGGRRPGNCPDEIPLFDAGVFHTGCSSCISLSELPGRVWTDESGGKKHLSRRYPGDMRQKTLDKREKDDL